MVKQGPHNSALHRTAGAAGELSVRPRCARPNGARDQVSCSPAHSAAEQLNEAAIPLCGTPLRFAPWLGGRTHACTRPSRSSAYLALR
jgi:hypothetical protein